MRHQNEIFHDFDDGASSYSGEKRSSSPCCCCALSVRCILLCVPRCVFQALCRTLTCTAMLAVLSLLCCAPLIYVAVFAYTSAEGVFIPSHTPLADREPNMEAVAVFNAAVADYDAASGYYGYTPDSYANKTGWNVTAASSFSSSSASFGRGADVGVAISSSAKQNITPSLINPLAFLQPATVALQTFVYDTYIIGQPKTFTLRNRSQWVNMRSFGGGPQHQSQDYVSTVLTSSSTVYPDGGGSITGGVLVPPPSNDYNDWHDGEMGLAIGLNLSVASLLASSGDGGAATPPSSSVTSVASDSYLVLPTIYYRATSPSRVSLQCADEDGCSAAAMAKACVSTYGARSLYSGSGCAEEGSCGSCTYFSYISQVCLAVDVPALLRAYGGDGGDYSSKRTQRSIHNADTASSSSSEEGRTAGGQKVSASSSSSYPTGISPCSYPFATSPDTDKATPWYRRQNGRNSAMGTTQFAFTLRRADDPYRTIQLLSKGDGSIPGAVPYDVVQDEIDEAEDKAALYYLLFGFMIALAVMCLCGSVALAAYSCSGDDASCFYSQRKKGDDGGGCGALDQSVLGWDDRPSSSAAATRAAMPFSSPAASPESDDRQFSYGMPPPPPPAKPSWAVTGGVSADTGIQHGALGGSGGAFDSESAIATTPAMCRVEKPYEYQPMK